MSDGGSTRAGEVEVSVVVAFRNRSYLLGGLLSTLATQQCDVSWEVVAVDNGSTDDAPAVAAEFQSRLDLRIVPAPARRGPSYARNQGVLNARGRKLLFVDADDEVGPGYLAAMVRALETAAVVTPRVDSSSLNPEWVRAAHGTPWQEHGVSVYFDFMPATGSNLGLRRDLFERAGGFPEDLSHGEDIAFAWTLQMLTGQPLTFVGDAIYRYRYRDTYAGLFRQSVAWGRAGVLLFRKFGRHGMPGRSLRTALADWRSAIGELATARTSSRRATAVVNLGYCLGRTWASARYGTWYP